LADLIQSDANGLWIVLPTPFAELLRVNLEGDVQTRSLIATDDCEGTAPVEVGGIAPVGGSVWMLFRDGGLGVVRSFGGAVPLEWHARSDDMFLITADESRVILLSEDGSRVEIHSFIGQPTAPKVLDARPPCGNLCSVASLGDSIFAVSHIYQEIYRLRIDRPENGQPRWETVATNCQFGPLFVATYRGRVVALGEADNGARVVVEGTNACTISGLDVYRDWDVEGFAISGNSYHVLLNSLGSGFLLVNLRADGQDVKQLSVQQLGAH
jgi:hypothetical protein